MKTEEILKGLQGAGFISYSNDEEDRENPWTCWIKNDIGVYVGDVLSDLGFEKKTETTNQPVVGLRNWTVYENDSMIITHRDLSEYDAETFTIDYK